MSKVHRLDDTPSNSPLILDQITRLNGGNHFETPHLTRRPGRRDYQASNGAISDFKLTEIRKVEKWVFYTTMFEY
jgi:hypothetical protein